MAHATAVAEEAVGNVRTVRAFAMEDSETDIYVEEVNKSRDMHIRLGIGIGCFQVRLFFPAPSFAGYGTMSGRINMERNMLFIDWIVVKKTCY